MPKLTHEHAQELNQRVHTGDVIRTTAREYLKRASPAYTHAGEVRANIEFAHKWGLTDKPDVLY